MERSFSRSAMTTQGLAKAIVQAGDAKGKLMATNGRKVKRPMSTSEMLKIHISCHPLTFCHFPNTFAERHDAEVIIHVTVAQNYPMLNSDCVRLKANDKGISCY